MVRNSLQESATAKSNDTRHAVRAFHLRDVTGAVQQMDRGISALAGGVAARNNAVLPAPDDLCRGSQTLQGGLHVEGLRAIGQNGLRHVGLRGAHCGIAARAHAASA